MGKSNKTSNSGSLSAACCLPPSPDDLSDIPIVAVSGYPGSGKTTLIGKLTAELKGRGYRLAVIKHTHHHLDNPGKDTERHISSGAEASLLVSADRIVLTRPVEEAPSLADILQVLGTNYDLILCEGFKASPLPKLALCQSKEELDSLDNVVKTVSTVPYGADPEIFSDKNIKDIADFLETSYITPRLGKVAIYVNRAKVPLIEFPRAILTKGITGMLSALKGVEEMKSIEITISNPGEVVRP